MNAFFKLEISLFWHLRFTGNMIQHHHRWNTSLKFNSLPKINPSKHRAEYQRQRIHDPETSLLLEFFFFFFFFVQPPLFRPALTIHTRIRDECDPQSHQTTLLIPLGSLFLFKSEIEMAPVRLLMFRMSQTAGQPLQNLSGCDMRTSWWHLTTSLCSPPPSVHNTDVTGAAFLIIRFQIRWFMQNALKKKLKKKLTVTPAQVAAPVQLEALPVAVRRADGESIARQEVWSPRAALGQSLRLVQLLTLRTLMCSRGSHANISRIPK